MEATDMRDFLKVVKALSDPNRVKMVKMLQRRMRKAKAPEHGPVVIEDFDDGRPGYGEPAFVRHRTSVLETVLSSRCGSSLPAPILPTQRSHPHERLALFLAQTAYETMITRSNDGRYKT